METKLSKFISYGTNISMLEEIGLERELFGKVAQMKLQYFRHITREVQEIWH